MRRFLLILLFLLYAHTTIAQAPALDSLSAEETSLMNQNTANTPWGHWAMLDSFYRKGDTLAASKELLKIDPYYFIIESIPPARIDTYILSQFHLNDSSVAQYKTIYNTAFKSPRSDTFLMFKKMWDDAQKIRKTLEMCGNTATCDWALRKMATIDSTNLFGLINYLKQSGIWPSYRNGAVYASYIAIQGHKRYNYLYPFFRNAAIEGKVEPSLLKAFSLKKLFLTGSPGIEERTDILKYRMFYMPSIYNFQWPNNLERLHHVAQEFCPVSFRFVFRCRYPKKFDEWVKQLRKTETGGSTPSILSQLTTELVPYCPKTIVEGVWDIQYVPSQNETPEIYIYMVALTKLRKDIDFKKLSQAIALPR